MIAEAFLLCALSVQPTFVGQKNWQIMAMAGDESIKAHKKFLQGLLLSEEFLDVSRKWTEETAGRILVIEGWDASFVRSLRAQGLRAFGLMFSPHQGKTPWHVGGTATAIPYLPETFFLTYWLRPVLRSDPWCAILREAIISVENNGFFIFPERHCFAWASLLEGWGWEALPFQINNLSVWKKPARQKYYWHDTQAYSPANAGPLLSGTILTGLYDLDLQFVMPAVLISYACMAASIEWYGDYSDSRRRDRFLTEMLLSEDFLNYASQRRGKTSGRTLVVNSGNVSLINKLRMHGLNVFGMVTSRAQEITHWHTIGSIGAIPYLPKTFYIVYWLHPVKQSDDYRAILKDAISVVERNGFFAFHPKDAYHWEEALEVMGWEKLPFSIDSLHIWQKPEWALPSDEKWRELRYPKWTHEEIYKNSNRAFLRSA